MRSGMVLLSLLVATPLLAQTGRPSARVIVPKVGTVIEVTPGEPFYTELGMVPVPAFRLSMPFKSSMAGFMGFPFGFAIDSTLLVRTRFRPGDYWTYFVPKDHAFRAYHGLLGSVLSEGDSVGLRIGKNGEREWYVDNSRRNGQPTLWTRKVKKGDPAISLEVDGYEGDGQPAERLIFLGTDGDKIRVREETLTPRNLATDDFVFPMDAKGRGTGAVKGVEFAFVATPQRAAFTTVKNTDAE